MFGGDGSMHMKKNRICSLLGIDYPILQGGMLWIANAELAAAVSEAGGFGIVSPIAGMEKHGDTASNLEKHIAKAKSLTKKPFGVNIPLDLQQSGVLIDVVLKENVGVVVNRCQILNSE
jgi:enoyl-[acyl-carrier protein] reductase II